MSDSYLSDPSHVPLVSPRSAPSDLSTKAATAPLNRTWLIFNEPDLQGQDDISSSQAASYYTSYYDQIKAGSGGQARLVVGGTVYMLTTSRGYTWWTEFLAQVQRPIEGIHIHAYPGMGINGWFTEPHCDPYQGSGDLHTATVCLTGQLEASYRFFQAQQKTAGKPIWITETSFPSEGYYTQTYVRDNFMVPLMNWYVSAKSGQYPLFERLAWFSDYCPGFSDSNLLNSDGSLTPLGAQWRNY